MIEIVVKSLALLEQFLVWLRDKRVAAARVLLNQDAIDALKLSREKKDTSKLDAIFNSDTSTQ